MTDHHADVIFELSEIALLPEPFLIEAGRTREKRFAGGDGEDRRCEAEFFIGGVFEMTVDNGDLARFP